MEKRFDVMIESAIKGKNQDTLSQSTLSGRDAKKLSRYLESNDSISGQTMITALMNSIGISELNANMGKIVACPTAGSAGILPGAFITVMEKKNIEKEMMVKGLFTAAAIGDIIAKKASLSGAKGGCQAECGSGAAMAAGAIVDILCSDPIKIAHAVSIALKNVMGLVCDPVATLVEVPCVKRNAIGVANALISADMALAGIESKIPADEVIEAMESVSRLMPSSLKETGIGGIAGTKTAKEYEKKIFPEKNFR
jgi:L-serine dehydratase